MSETARDILVAIQNPVSLENDISKSNFDLKIFPNPADELVQLEYQLDKKTSLNIELLNSVGQVIISQNFNNQNPGSYKVPSDIKDMPKGIYFIKIKSDHDLETIPFIKK